MTLWQGCLLGDGTKDFFQMLLLGQHEKFLLCSKYFGGIDVVVGNPVDCVGHLPPGVVAQDPCHYLIQSIVYIYYIYVYIF